MSLVREALRRLQISWRKTITGISMLFDFDSVIDELILFLLQSVISWLDLP